MKVKQRQEKIVQITRKKERATVEELAQLLNISRETIRRDLTDLDKSGKIQKIHGGATLPRVFGEGSFQHRMLNCVEAKSRIAQKAASLFGAGETIFINTGSTTVYFAEKLSEIAGVTVVTNSTEIAKTVAPNTRRGQTGVDCKIRTFLLGGEFSPDERKTVGTMVVSQIRSFRAHHAVLTIGALDGRTGAMDYEIEAAQVSRAMVEQSEQLTVLLDATKFDKLASFEVCPLTKINRLIVDQMPPAALAKTLETAGIEIIQAY